MLSLRYCLSVWSLRHWDVRTVGKTDVVDVRIVSDKGEAFPKYKTFLRGHREGEYYYMEAVKGQRYSIQVTNKSDRRIGLCHRSGWKKYH